MNGALKSALRTSTFKTSGKQVFFSDSGGKWKQASVSIASMSSTASRARLVEDPSSRAPLKIVDALPLEPWDLPRA